MDTIKFLVKFLGSPLQPSADGNNQPKLVTEDQGEISGLATVARYIANQSDKAQHLLGATAEEQAQVDEWLAWSTSELQPLVDEKLAKVNDWLLTRTYLVGQSLTLADIVVFGGIHPAAVNFPAAQTLHFIALLRWFDLIQYLTCAASSFPKNLTMSKPAFVAPVVALPPPKEAKPTADAAASSSSAPEKGDKKGSAPAVAAAAAPLPAPAEAKKGESKPEGGKKEAKGDGKKEAKGDVKGEAKGGAAKKEEELHIGMLDIRVGTIVKVGPHPNADSLYLEEIDLGEEKPRQVISGLVKFVPQDKMENRRVVVVCNLKPAKMREVMSYGMVLCASNDTHDQVDPIIPPEGVPNGERIKFAGWDEEPMAEVNPKKKILERLFPDMKTDASCIPNFKGIPFNTSKGPVTATIPNAHVA